MKSNPLSLTKLELILSEVSLLKQVILLKSTSLIINYFEFNVDFK